VDRADDEEGDDDGAIENEDKDDDAKSWDGSADLQGWCNVCEWYVHGPGQCLPVTFLWMTLIDGELSEGYKVARLKLVWNCIGHPF
jgi:hypothetical protein